MPFRSPRLTFLRRKLPTVHSVLMLNKLVPSGSPKWFKEINDVSDVVILKYVVNCIIIYAIYFIHIFLNHFLR